MTSCPQDVTAPMVALAEDIIQPTISITSPSGSDNYYYSTVTITGVITDDVIAENDGDGQIASVFYEIANDDHRKGKINIGLDDTVTVDTNFGSQEIEFTVINGEFSFTFPTTNPTYLRDLISLTITAVDRNNNAVEKTFSLTESNGPYVGVNFYKAPDYIEENLVTAFDGDVVYISCSLGNSQYDKINYDELSSFSWGFIGNNKGGELDLSADSPHWVAAEGLFKNETTHDIDKFTTYNPATGEIRTSTDLPSTTTGSNFYFEATDIYGHITRVENLLPIPATLELSSVKPSLVYYSPMGLSDSTMTINLSSKVFDPVEFIISPDKINSVECTFTSSITTETPPGKITIYPGVGDFDTTFNMLNADTNYRGTFLVPIEFGTGTDFLGLAGNLSAKITVKDKDDSPIEARRTLLRDADPPSFSVTGFSTTGGNILTGKTYLNENDTATLTFTCTDLLSGVNSIESVKINGNTVATNMPYETDNSYSVTYPLTDSNIADEANLEYSITAVDNVGNADTISSSDVNIFYYHDYPGNEPNMGWETSNTSYSDWARAVDTIEGTINSNRALSTNSTINIAGMGNVAITAAAPYTATSIALSNAGLGENTNITYSVYVEDAAGNSTTLTGDTLKNYDGTPPFVTFSASLTSSPPAFTGAFSVTPDAGLYHYTLIEGSGLSSRTWAITPTGSTITDSAAETLNVTAASDNNYTAALNFTDSAGNPSIEKTFDFSWDVNGPVITPAGFTSTDGEAAGGKTYFNATDEVTLSFTATDTPSGLDSITEVLINGNNVTGSVVEASPGSFSVVYELTDGAIADEAELNYSISAIDIAGNPSTTGIQTDSNKIYYHAYGAGSYPGLSWASSNTSYPDWTRAADTIEGTITSTRVLSTNSTINIASMGVVAITGTGPYTATSIALSNASLAENADIAYSVYVEDAAGNSTTLTGDTSINYDGTKPVIAFSANLLATPTISDPFEVTTSDADTYYYDITGGPGIDSSSWTVPGDLNPTATDTASLNIESGDPGNYTISLVITDDAGNPSDPTSFTIDFDDTPPAVPSTITSTAVDGYINLAEHTAGNTTINVGYGNMDATDSIRLYFNSSAYATTIYEADKSIAFEIDNTDLETTNNFSAVSVDSLGNESASVDLTLVRDLTAPSFSFSASLSGTPLLDAAFDVTGTATDPYYYVLTETGSGIDTYNWTVTGPSSFSDTETGDTLHIITSAGIGVQLPTGGGVTDGDYTAEITATDLAGNASTPYSFLFGWDGDQNGSKSISGLTPKLQSGGTTGSSTPSSGGRISPANFNTTGSSASGASGSTQASVMSTSLRNASASPSRTYNGSFYRASASTVKTSASANMQNNETASPEAEDAIPEEETTEIGGPTAAPTNISSMSSKASSAFTGGETVKALDTSPVDPQRTAGILPFGIILLLSGCSAVIIVRKRRL
jgi:hypothetical protein